MNDENNLWKAVAKRDAAMDGQFVYGVLTTKIFCRPGCASRTPLRKNVRFYRTASEAVADGLRACLRCHPEEDHKDSAGRFQTATQIQTDALRELFTRVCTYIRQNLEDRKTLKLDALSAHFGLSSFHFQRSFKAVVGVTPKQYAEGIRMQTLKEKLREGGPVTDAIYDAGFGASSRVYSALDTRLGMTPKQYRAGGKSVEISYAMAETPLGLVMIGATDRGLCFLEFGATKEELLESLEQEYPTATRVAMAKPYSEEFVRWMQALAGYIEGERVPGKMSLALHGTAFQLKVWQYLQTIPAGSVQSYAEVAAGIGQPKAARAVASACAANRIAVVIPCHRVIRGDGNLGGYRWGFKRKRALLDAERRASK